MFAEGEQELKGGGEGIDFDDFDGLWIYLYTSTVPTEVCNVPTYSYRTARQCTLVMSLEILFEQAVPSTEFASRHRGSVGSPALPKNF